MTTKRQPLSRTKLTNAGLIVLGILQFLMLGALYAQVAPHPPAIITPFAIAPFLAVAISLITIAIYLQGSRLALYLALLSCATALGSFGPQKYFDPAFPHIWPAVITAQIAIVVIVISVFKSFKEGN